MEQPRYTCRNKCSYSLSELCVETFAFGNLNIFYQEAVSQIYSV